MKGKIFQLIRPIDPKYIKALDASAGKYIVTETKRYKCIGGKLHFIIVDNEQTAKSLMKRRSFQYSVNLIPNNKIQSQGFIPENVVFLQFHEE